MKDEPVSMGDLLAVMDVIGRLIELSDEMDLETAVATLEVLGQLGSEVRRAQSMVETQEMRLLEQPKIIDGQRYVKTPKYTRRFDHDRVARLVRDRAAVDRRTGEVNHTMAAVGLAISLMRKIYVSDSTDAKVTALKTYLGVGDVIAENLARDERTGTIVKVYPLREEENNE